MGTSVDTIYKTKRKMLTKYPRFGSEIASANIEFKDDLPYKTAATDGKTIYVDPDYFESLNEDERLFLIAHETMHIKFMHMHRLEDKDGNRRDPNLWNIATDAIINANLKRDGFKIKDGYINMPEALNYSAEEFYQILLKEKEEREQNQQEKPQKQAQDDENKKQQEEQQNQEENDNSKNDLSSGNEEEHNEEKEGQENNGQNPQPQGDDHGLWEKAFEEYKEQEEKKEEDKKAKDQKEDKNKKEKNQDKKPDQELPNEQEFNEKQEFEANRKEKIEKFKNRREKIEKSIRGEEPITFGDIGRSKEEIDWKLLLRREIDKTETIWSQRRSIAENNYAYRLEENDIEDEAETEVMIDVSGSVDEDMVKGFLRQLKPLLKESKLRVGCFNEKFWGLVDIKNEKDIDNFAIPREARGYYAWTEDWDLAVRSFTKKREVNKIVFTDGYPAPGTMPKEDLKKENVIWLVYGNKDFQPCCGKVINITEKQLEKLYQVDRNDMER